MAAIILTGSSTAFAGSFGEDLSFGAELSTDQEIPAPGPGLIEKSNVSAKFDQAFTEVDVRLKIAGGDNVVAAHFHCALPGEIGPVAFGLFSPGPLVFDGSVAPPFRAHWKYRTS